MGPGLNGWFYGAALSSSVSQRIHFLWTYCCVVSPAPPPSRPNAQIKQRDVREDVFSQVRWQMYAAREAGVPTVAYRLPAVTQEDGEMEGRDRVRGREGRWGGRTEGVAMTRGHQPRGALSPPPPPSFPSYLALRVLICPSDHNKNKTKRGSSEETRVTSGRGNTK